MLALHVLSRNIIELKLCTTAENSASEDVALIVYSLSFCSTSIVAVIDK